MCTLLRFRLSLLELEIEVEEGLMTLEVAAAAAADCEAAMLATKELTNSWVVRPNRFIVSKESKATASLPLISDV